MEHERTTRVDLGRVPTVLLLFLRTRDFPVYSLHCRTGKLLPSIVISRKVIDIGCHFLCVIIYFTGVIRCDVIIKYRYDEIQCVNNGSTANSQY